MPRASKSKQPPISTPLTTRGRARAMAVATNPHRKNSKAWREWETANNPTIMVEPTAPTAGPSLTDVPESSESTSKALQDIATRLRALDDYATDKWDGLDQLLDQKIEILAASIANRLEPLINSNSSGNNALGGRTTLTEQPLMPTTNLNGNPLVNLTSLWNWVDKTVLATILALEFDVTDLYKLTPPEDASLFNLKLDTATHGGILINPDGSLSAVTATSKLDKSLPSFAHWFSAFSVYASIRAAYDRTGTMGPALIMFTREMNHYQLNFPWPQVLRYFLETFRDCQSKPAQAWLQPNVRAYTKFLHHNTAPAGNRLTSKASSSKSSTNHSGAGQRESPQKRYTAEEKALQICQAYNLPDKGCKPVCPYGRRHVCLISSCGKPHPQYEHK